MILGPVFYIEMLGLGRRRRYVLTRVVYGFILLLLMGTCYAGTFTSWRPSTLQLQAEFAYNFFVAFSWVQLFAVLGLTPAMIAGTIANEHERRTIDYLLTTSLTDAEITLGKFSARLLAIGGQLAAGLPILAIAMTLGGIMPEQLAKSFGVSLLSLASIGGLSLAVSCRSRTSREAITTCYLVLFAAMIVPAVLWGLIESLQPGAVPGTAWAEIVDWSANALQTTVEFNPVVFLVIALFNPPLNHIDMTTFAVAHLSAAVLLTASSVVGLRRFYVRQLGKGVQNKKGRRRWGVPQLGDQAMWWKERVAGRNGAKLGRFGRLAAVGLYLVAVYVLGWTFLESLDDHLDSHPTRIEAFAVGGVPAIACLALLLVTARTAGSVTSEREQDTWVTLLSTPLEPHEIVRAKIAGAIYSVRYWYLLIGLAWCLCAVVRTGFVWTIPAVLCVHVVMLATAATLGFICSLALKTSLRSMGMALGLLVLASWIGPLFFATITRTGELTAFSPPAAMGAAQAVAIQFLIDPDRHESWAVKMTVFTCFSVAAYAVLAAILYRQAVGNFDWFAERIVARFEITTKIGSPREPTGESAAELQPENET